jgi:apolipoprotein N-acyltransferase
MHLIADAIIVLWGWRRFAAAFLAGALSALALPPVSAFPVLWLTMPILVWLIDGAIVGAGKGVIRSLMPAAIVGWAFGFGYFLAGLWWIGAAFLVDADKFAWLLPFAVLAMPAGLAIFWALAAAGARLVWPDGWRRILVLAVALTAAEWLRGHVLTGFPWNAFGYTLTPVPLMMQSASVVGLAARERPVRRLRRAAARRSHRVRPRAACRRHRCGASRSEAPHRPAGNRPEREMAGGE